MPAGAATRRKQQTRKPLNLDDDLNLGFLECLCRTNASKKPTSRSRYRLIKAKVIIYLREAWMTIS